MPRTALISRNPGRAGFGRAAGLTARGRSGGSSGGSSDALADPCVGIGVEKGPG